MSLFLNNDFWIFQITFSDVLLKGRNLNFPEFDYFPGIMYHDF